MGRLAILVLTGVLCASAQMKMTVGQLNAFLRSSVDLKHDDGRVASYLKRVQLTEKLDARTIEDLQGYGIGPRTVQALEDLAGAAASLPEPKAAVPKPAPAPIPPPSPEEQRRVIDGAREYAMNYSKRLPDFICTQVTRRYVDPSGLEFWQRQDVITAKLSYFEQKEDYKIVLVNSHPVELDYNQVGGAISSGEFGTMMRELFDPETEATFHWLRWARLRGRRQHVYQYEVRQSRSRWRISWQKSWDITAAYKGEVYVDRDSGVVTRISLEAQGMPPSFPIQQASVLLDYDMVDIGGTPFMLPLKHTMRMREGKLLVKNDVEFRMYRKFGAEAVIKFDTPDELPEELITEEPPATPPAKP